MSHIEFLSFFVVGEDPIVALVIPSNGIVPHFNLTCELQTIRMKSTGSYKIDT
jgi:hypothetical protein